MRKSMLKPLRSVLAICFLLNAIVSFAADHSSPSPAVNIPFSFEINRGQTAPQVRYLARSPEGVLFFTDQGVTVSVPRVGAFRMLFESAAMPEISAERKMIARSNYLEHNGQSITNLENYGALLYTGIYPGIDVRVYGRERHLEHDFVLAPGADASKIALRFEGINHVAITSAGDAELSVGKVVL